ncbi:hypothetical protein FGG08_004322 [Glutinoglossum americanum]|uniref:Uncharacterized protein n=1 Tax=Glutinoglossum americanum TaxID=1670608 RepID=A0A9P8I600_9PEZI|nr:hypothetical protein FGG08_004322 [Glutinoglossum americanum]
MSEHGQTGRQADEEPISGQPDSPAVSPPSPVSPVSDNESGDSAVNEDTETRPQDRQDTERTPLPSRDIGLGNVDTQHVVATAGPASRDSSSATSSGIHGHEAGIELQHLPASDGENRNVPPEPSRSHSHASTLRPELEPPPQSAPDTQRRRWWTPLPFRLVSLMLLLIVSLAVNAVLIYLLVVSKRRTGIAPVSSIPRLARRLVPTASKVFHAHPSKVSKRSLADSRAFSNYNSSVLLEPLGFSSLPSAAMDIAAQRAGYGHSKP